MSRALLTDLYELTMADSFLQHGKTGRAVFSLSVRTLPPERNFLVSCGLEPLISFLTSCSFTPEDIAYLKEQEKFSEEFLQWLSTYRFHGDVFAIPEGRIFFESEPLIRIEGSLPEIQILETMALNLIHHQTVIATKAARMMMVSRGRGLIDFGLRRAHGPEGGTFAARAAYITGFLATSNVEAGRMYGIPISGTMAHSYVLIHNSEEEAFRAYIKTFPKDVILLIDTYDTRIGAEIASRLAIEGLPITGVRIDSGVIAEIVPEVRSILDKHGLHHIRIIVSGGVDEHDIASWMEAKIPIDAFGVGTRLLTSADIPYLDMTYKLVEYDGIPRSKTSTGKHTIPGRRNACRFYDSNGMMTHDDIIKAGTGSEGETLLMQVMKDGKQVIASPTLAECQKQFSQDYSHLPDHLKTLEKSTYPVNIRSD